MPETHKIDRYLDDYSETEQTLYKRVRRWRDSFFSPLALFFKKINVSANHLSYFGIFILSGFIYFVLSAPKLASLFLIIHVLIDGIDGVLARMLKQDDTEGDLVDTVCDHTGVFIVVLTLGFFGLLNPNLGLLYIYFYTVWLFFIIVRYWLKIPVRFVVRSKGLVYTLYIVWAFTGFNYLDIALAVFSILIIPLTITSFVKIKKELKGKKKSLKDF
jgi:archaetidylinositol phosphate synthase